MDDILNVGVRFALDGTIRLRELTIAQGAEITAPEGMFVNLCVNGTGKKVEPGVYEGDVILSVAGAYVMPPQGLMASMNRMENFGFKDTDYRNTVVIENGKLMKEKCIPAMMTGGEITDKAINGGVIKSCEDSFNGVLVTGNSRYEINGLKVDFEGIGANDFMGVGSAVAVIDNARVDINDCEFRVNGVTRSAIHAGGSSVVHVNNCRVSNQSPDAPEWLGSFAWGIGITGTNRLVQACDNTTIYYNNCDLDSNGWAVFSIDGHDECVRIFVKDSRINLSGPRTHGYGIFCIGNRNVTSFDHCRLYVDGYPLLVMGMRGCAKAEIKNGCDVTSTEYGVLAMGDNNTDITISDSRVATGKSSIVVKGSSTNLNVDNCRLTPGNGVILQLMDTDECGMDVDVINLPAGKQDVYEEGRDLCAADSVDDVILNLSNMDIKGDLYNSTTNLHIEDICVRGVEMAQLPIFGGLYYTAERDPEYVRPAPPPEMLEQSRKLRGPKNLGLNLRNARLEGVVSSASFEYRPGLTRITERNRLELNNVLQKAAPTINNGVVISIDPDSTWIVTGVSYITSLRIERGAVMKAADGSGLRMTVDGAETAIRPGHYKGKIVIEPVCVI